MWKARILRSPVSNLWSPTDPPNGQVQSEALSASAVHSIHHQHDNIPAEARPIHLSAPVARFIIQWNQTLTAQHLRSKSFRETHRSRQARNPPWRCHWEAVYAHCLSLSKLINNRRPQSSARPTARPTTPASAAAVIAEFRSCRAANGCGTIHHPLSLEHFCRGGAPSRRDFKRSPAAAASPGSCHQRKRTTP